MTVADRLRSSTALASAADFQPPRNLKNEIEATLRACLNQSFGEWLKTALADDAEDCGCADLVPADAEYWRCPKCDAEYY